MLITFSHSKRRPVTLILAIMGLSPIHRAVDAGDLQDEIQSVSKRRRKRKRINSKKRYTGKL